MSVKLLLRFFVSGWGRDYITVFGGVSGLTIRRQVLLFSCNFRSRGHQRHAAIRWDNTGSLPLVTGFGYIVDDDSRARKQYGKCRYDNPDHYASSNSLKCPCPLFC